MGSMHHTAGFKRQHTLLILQQPTSANADKSPQAMPQQSKRTQSTARCEVSLRRALIWMKHQQSASAWGFGCSVHSCCTKLRGDLKTLLTAWGSLRCGRNLPAPGRTAAARTPPGGSPAPAQERHSPLGPTTALGTGPPPRGSAVPFCLQGQFSADKAGKAAAADNAYRRGGG